MTARDARNGPTIPGQQGTDLWTVQDVAAYLRVPAKTIYTWRGKGYGPPARRMGKHLRYRPVDVVAWAETSTETAA
jgi:predicted DNA-binding transcriptional regulator AlpA